MNPISVITCVVGVIGGVIGVATFFSAQMSKSKQDGVLIAKIDQCVHGIEEIKHDMKEKNHEFDFAIDEHSRKITELETQMNILWKKVNGN